MCANEATCIDGVNGYTCNCSPGYTGTYCRDGKLVGVWVEIRDVQPSVEITVAVTQASRDASRHAL